MPEPDVLVIRRPEAPRGSWHVLPDLAPPVPAPKPQTPTPRPWGCHNRQPLQMWATVQDGWTADERRNVRTIPIPWGPECRYTLTTNDSRCAGCRWRNPEHV